MRIRLILAIWACRLAIFGSRLLGKMGTSMPGHLAMRICPDILERLSRQVKKDIIVVCGTNGKTTTNNLLSAFIKSSGKEVVCNDLGANMIWGVCCAFAQKASLFGKLKADYACLEVDEASTVHVLRHIKPDYMVVTNLFRDQLDRYGTVEQTLDYIRRSLELSPDTKLILNADDPVVAQLGEDGTHFAHYVAVDEDAAGEKNPESGFCPYCGEKLNYEFHHYSQLGKFACPACNFKRREPDFKVQKVSLSDGLSFSFEYQGILTPFSVNLRGFYNIYNISLAYAAALLVLDKAPDHQSVLAGYQPQIGRMEEFFIGKPVILNMAKNPAGFNQALSAVLTDERQKDILIGVNDNPSDGQDISWLWDVDFERLAATSFGKIVVTGMRADELMLRLKHAGIPAEKQTKNRDLKQAAEEVLSGDSPVCYALANYTVVFPLQEILKEREGEGHGA